MATEERGSISYTSPTQEEFSEKKGVTTYATPVTPSEDDIEKGSGSNEINHEDWQPGFFAQFPWLGIGSLIGVLLCLAASIVVLVVSNGKTQTPIFEQRAWPKSVAPNVLVSIFNSIANICFGIAISNGVAIAWWRRALKGGTIKDLNRSWQFSSSVKEIALSGKAFNIIALTALVAKMTLIDSTLLQKSIGTYTQQDYLGNRTNVSYGYINETFPTTGVGSLDAFGGSGLLDWWNQDLEIWAAGGGLYPNQFSTYTTAFGKKKNPVTKKVKYINEYYNNSLAYIKINGAGFQIDCLDAVTEKINASALVYPSLTNVTEFKQQLLFAINFTVHTGVPDSSQTGPDAWVNTTDYIMMETAYSTAENVKPENEESQCPGQIVRQTCRLRPAVVTYPIELAQPGKDMAIWTARIGTDEIFNLDGPVFEFYKLNRTTKQQNYFQVNRTVDLTDYPVTELSSGDNPIGNNTLSGLAAGLQTYLGGFAYVSRVEGQGSYRLNQSGTSQTYLDNLPAIGTCDFNFHDPLDGGQDLLAGGGVSQGTPDSKFINPGLVGKINSIMFGLTTDVSGLDPNNLYKEDSSYTWHTASMWADTVHYSSNFWYMGGAIASTILCILCVLPSYWGFWQLGRKVTLGPFEIAAAFRAPNLNHPTAANAPVEKLIQEVGDRRVQFGHIVSGSDAGRIGVAEPEYVERVKPKIGAAGEEIRGRFQQTFTRK